MKKLLSCLSLVLTLAFANPSLLILPPTAAVLAGCTSGCASGKGAYNPSTHTYDADADADKVVMAAQKTRSIALDVFDLFLSTERQNEEALKKVNPAIHVAAEQIRANGKTWIEDLSKAIATYQSNRTASNEANLRQILATIQSAIASAQDALLRSLERK